MGLKGAITCVLLCSLAALNTNKAVEIEDSVLKQLLNTPTVIPTKNGYYVFVPSKNETQNGNQNPNQIEGPNSNQNNNQGSNQNSNPNSNQGPSQNNLIIVVPPTSNQSPNGNDNSDANKKPTTPSEEQKSNSNENNKPAGANDGKKPDFNGNEKPEDSNNNENANNDQNQKPTDSNDNKNADSNNDQKPADSSDDKNNDFDSNQKSDDSDNDKNSDANKDETPADSGDEKNADSKNNESPDNSGDSKPDDSKNNDKPADADDGKKSDSESQKPEESDQNAKAKEDEKPPVPECCKTKGKKAGDNSANANKESSKPTSDVKPLIPQSRGVNRASAESHCVQNLGIFDGPTDQASVDAMKKYNINIVRIPLNQDCWLALNEFSWGQNFGDNYRKAVTEYVKLLRTNDIKVILDLHWSDGSHQGAQCNDFSAKCQKPMPDSYNAPNFWKSVANQFKDDDSIIFDLFNNPYPDLAIKDSDKAWKCWRDGGNDCFEGIHYNVAGMQDLVNAVRGTGANNYLMIGGLRFANDLSKWEYWVPKDPQNKIIASWHTYKDSQCNTEACWEKEIAPLAKKYPLIAGEIGEGGCSHDYTVQIMNWLDKQQISYLGWAWKAGECSARPALVSDYSGTPTEYGKGLLNHISNRDAKDQNAADQNSASANNGEDASDDSCVCPADSAEDQADANKKAVEEKKPEEKPAKEKKPEEPKKKSLKGVNRSSFEYSCVKNLGISEGPLDDASIQVMKTWNIDIVRVPLNEDCWLGMGGHNANNIGDKYRKAVEEYVRRLRKNGLKVIVDLHWTDGLYGGPGQGSCYDVAAKCQKPMPDMSHAPRFWKSVATLFKDDDGIIFDIFNEPFPDMVISDKNQAWKCLRDGGKECPGFQFEVAGMQDLVNAVRKTGAKNLIMSPGITWTNDLSRWLEFKPKDPANNLAASWHSYDFNACNNQGCWDSQIAPVAAEHPVYVGEIGEHGCSHGYVDKLMPWLDSKNINYLGWTWNNWDCSSGPALISDFNGTPTNFGVGLRDHFKKA